MNKIKTELLRQVPKKLPPPYQRNAYTLAGKAYGTGCSNCPAGHALDEALEVGDFRALQRASGAHIRTFMLIVAEAL